MTASATRRISNVSPKKGSGQLYIYVVDDHAPMRASLKALLGDRGIVRTFGSAEEFLEIADSLSPGILLTDIRMDGMTGLQLVAQLSSDQSRFRPIIMTAHGDVDAAIAALRAGACDFLQKPFREEELIGIIDREANRLDGPSSGHALRDEAQALLRTLSPRELEVAQGLMRGGTNKSIAHDLGLSVRTVEMHRARAMARLGCKTLAELVSLCLLGDALNPHSQA